MLARVFLITVFTFIMCSVMLSALADRRLGPARQWAAQNLIDIAWQRTAAEGRPVSPWPGASGSPIARIIIPALNESRVVMSGAGSDILPYAAVWNEGSTEPGAPGISVISGYRDSSFSFMSRLEKGMAVVLQTPGGADRSYVISDVAVTQDTEITLDPAGEQGALVLSATYTLSAGGSGRYLHLVAVARPQPEGLVM